MRARYPFLILTPIETGLPSFLVRIEEILGFQKKDEQLNRSTVIVTSKINQTPNVLKHQSQIFATIQYDQPVPLYEMARREVCTKFKLRKYMDVLCR